MEKKFCGVCAVLIPFLRQYDPARQGFFLLLQGVYGQDEVGFSFALLLLLGTGRARRKGKRVLTLLKPLAGNNLNKN